MLFYEPEIASGVLWLSEEEARHCVKVLRKREGDPIEVTDGQGSFFDCAITKADVRRCEFQVTGRRTEAQKNYRIHIAIAPTKNADRMEWFVEKSVELGVDEVTLMNCDHSERNFLKIDRLQKMAISAMKQSKRAFLPRINASVEFSEVIALPAAQRFIAYVDKANPDHLFSKAAAGGDYLVLIGPEGDFSPGELSDALAAGFEKVSLGNTRLRTETAGLAACSILATKNSL